MALDDDARAELKRLEGIHRRRGARVVDGAPGPHITLDGANVLNLSSNDYLSLAGDARLARAAAAAADEYGTGASASRLITGHHRRHVLLERAIGDWLERDGVRVFSSGYAANVGTITTLVGPGDVVFSDQLNHASIVDGCRLSRAEISVFGHRDLGALERGLAACTAKRKLVISETLFSMDGDIADVRALDELCRRHDAALMLDEAHAIGTLGPQGRGVAAAAGVIPDVLVGTCGKALGVSGAFVVSSSAVVELLWNRARSFVFSTAIPPLLCAAIEAGIAIVRSHEGSDRRAGLLENARLVGERLVGTREAVTPIVPVVVGDDALVMQQTSALLAKGIFAQGIRPPTVPEGASRLRVSVCSGHKVDELRAAANAIAEVVGR